MILHAQLLVIGGGRNIQHVLDPVFAVGHLHGLPVDAVFLESATPVEAEAQQVAIETVFGGAVAHDETGVNEAGADLLAAGGGGFGGGVGRLGELLDEGQRLAVGIGRFEMLRAVGVFGNCADRDFVSDQVAVHLRRSSVAKATSARKLGAGGLAAATSSMRWRGLTAKHALMGPRQPALGGSQAEDVAVERGGGAKIRGVQADVGDAGDSGARRRFGGGEAEEEGSDGGPKREIIHGGGSETRGNYVWGGSGPLT